MAARSSNSNFSLWDLLRRVFTQHSSPPPITTPADNLLEPVKIITSRVLLVVYDPVMDPTTGTKLSTMMKWKRPSDLVSAFIQDILQASHGMARFQVVERLELDELPTQVDGFSYTPQNYLSVINNNQSPHTPPMADYAAILSRLDIAARITKREIDEVWLFAFPYAGFYESTMAGAGAFWCNAPPITKTANSARRFVVMGFSYERGGGEMLESFGHRAESILEKTFSKTTEAANLFIKFTRYEKKNPGLAEVGNIHFAPNSSKDYEWNNQRLVLSACDDWYNFPNFKGVRRLVNAAEWGNGDIRAHHTWWLNHIPHVAGRTNGVHNNWWQYIMDPNLVV
jgi:hypothetical protein